ncbi:Uncharacterised protein [Yersinia rohdei]|nr:Uncharacterised protein [Yersinia rohdei]
MRYYSNLERDKCCNMLIDRLKFQHLNEIYGSYYESINI